MYMKSIQIECYKMDLRHRCRRSVFFFSILNRLRWYCLSVGLATMTMILFKPRCRSIVMNKMTLRKTKIARRVTNFWSMDQKESYPESSLYFKSRRRRGNSNRIETSSRRYFQIFMQTVAKRIASCMIFFSYHWNKYRRLRLKGFRIKCDHLCDFQDCLKEVESALRSNWMIGLECIFIRTSCKLLIRLVICQKKKPYWVFDEEVKSWLFLSFLYKYRKVWMIFFTIVLCGLLKIELI